MIKTPKSTKIGSFTGSSTTTAIGFDFFEAIPDVYTADFVNGIYKVNNTDSTFNNLFTFNRAGKAWLVKDSGLVEYAIDVPRFDNGLLIEQSATSYSVPYDNIVLGDSTTRTANTYKTIAVDSRGSYLQFNPLNVYPAGVPTLPAWNNTVITKAIKVIGTGSNQQVAITTRDEYRGSFARLKADLSVTGTGARYEYNYLYSVVSGFAGASAGALFYPSQMTVLWGDIAANASTTPKVNATLDISDFQYIKGTHPSTLIGDKSASSITRPADFLSLKFTTGSSIAGDWDSTLSLSLINGQIQRTGYGRIRSLEII